MKVIFANNGTPIKVDDDWYLELLRYKWQILSSGYPKRSTTKNGKNITLLMHRIVMSAKPGQVVDHINGDPLDNRVSNLRFATVSQNSANSRISKRNKTGYKGVHTQSRSTSFESTITMGRKQIYIGRFETACAAARAYDNKAKELFGLFAKLNFPEEI